MKFLLISLEFKTIFLFESCKKSSSSVLTSAGSWSGLLLPPHSSPRTDLSLTELRTCCPDCLQRPPGLAATSSSASLIGPQLAWLLSLDGRAAASKLSRTSNLAHFNVAKCLLELVQWCEADVLNLQLEIRARTEDRRGRGQKGGESCHEWLHLKTPGQANQTSWLPWDMNS